MTDHILELLLALLGHVLGNSSGLAISKVEAILLIFSYLSGANGTTEEVLVLLLGEVDVIITVRVGILRGVVAIILVKRVGTHVDSLTVLPRFKGQVSYRAALVEIGNNHSAFVSVVIDHLSAEVPLFLFAEAFENMVGANLHDGDLVGEASLRGVLGGTLLILANFLVATAGDVGGTKGHVL